MAFFALERAYAPGFDDLRRTKTVRGKTGQFVQFRPHTTPREIIKVTAKTIWNGERDRPGRSQRRPAAGIFDGG